MARVEFTARKHLRMPAPAVFGALVDWRGHADWVPMTRVRIEEGDGGEGTVFVATTGLGPAALPDRMRVESLDAQAMTADIVKIGPVLRGDVHIGVAPLSNTTCEVRWHEDITVPGVPSFAAPAVATATRKAFEKSLDRLAKRLR